MAIETRPNSVTSKMAPTPQENSPTQNVSEGEKVPPKKPTLSKPEPKNDLLHKIHNTFFQGRNLSDVAAGVIKNWLIPAVLDSIATTAKATIDGMFYGSNGAPTNYNRPSTGFGVGQNPTFYSNLTRSIVSGGGIVVSGSNVQNQNINQPQFQQYVNQYRHGFQNVALPMHKDAANVREYLWEYLAIYGQVRVADFYDACGDYAAHIIQQYTDNNWGWKNLDGLNVIRVPEGWILTLPEPISLK